MEKEVKEGMKDRKASHHYYHEHWMRLCLCLCMRTSINCFQENESRTFFVISRVSLPYKIFIIKYRRGNEVRWKYVQEKVQMKLFNKRHKQTFLSIHNVRVPALFVQGKKKKVEIVKIFFPIDIFLLLSVHKSGWRSSHQYFIFFYTVIIIQSISVHNDTLVIFE